MIIPFGLWIGIILLILLGDAAVGILILKRSNPKQKKIRLGIVVAVMIMSIVCLAFLLLLMRGGPHGGPNFMLQAPFWTDKEKFPDIYRYNTDDPRLWNYLDRIQKETGSPRLISATTAGRLDLVEKMVERGDDVNTHSLDGTTPLKAARNSRHYEIEDFLISHGAK